jgi:putative ABC transport system permease protein
MLRHYLALAVRNIARTKLYAAISVIGLSVGFAAATLIGLYVHDELTYDRWLPNHERIYQVSAALSTGVPSGAGPSDLGRWVASDFPQFEHVTRLFRDGAFLVPSDRPDFKANEVLMWADANVFDVFRFPVVSGSLDGAFTQPDSLVITRAIAEKYFGESDAVGKTLLWNGEQPMIVKAVIEDLPSNTHLTPLTILAAGHAPYSALALQDRTPMAVFGGKLWGSASYGLLKPNEPIEPIRESLKTLINRHAPTVLSGTKSASEVWALSIRPIAAIHLSANRADAPESEALTSIYTVSAIGLLIVLVASINFVNLLTALGIRRALEVGVRKASGARRSDLFAQFMSESFLYIGVGAIAGLAIAAAALRPLNTFLRRTIDFSMFADWRVAAGTLLFLAAVAFLAGLYPALVLSSFRPATVTKGGRMGRGQGAVRQVLVVLQFAILTALLIATTVTYRQMQLGMREALRQNTDPIVLLAGPCNDTLKGEMLRQPGVVAAACSMGLPQWGFQLGSAMKLGDREPVPTRYLPLDFGFFELYGMKLVGGRYWDERLATDAVPADNVWTAPESVVINETLARALGFGAGHEAEAVGQNVAWGHLFRFPATFTAPHDSNIIGVVEDFQIGRVRDPIPPAAFFVDPGLFRNLSLKLDGRSTPEALDAIDRVWKEYAGPAPQQRFFFEQSVQNMYVDLIRQTTLFSVCAGIAVLIAVLGLVGLAAHAAVSRTKEIGIRKAIGGGRWAITRLLLWQFSRPVLLANVVAWPVTYWVMSGWLQGFAKRVELDWWLFVVAGGVTVIMAVAAVLVHTWTMAGTRPVTALRYE